jgi:hypothetical protein
MAGAAHIERGAQPPRTSRVGTARRTTSLPWRWHSAMASPRITAGRLVHLLAWVAVASAGGGVVNPDRPAPAPSPSQSHYSPPPPPPPQAALEGPLPAQCCTVMDYILCGMGMREGSLVQQYNEAIERTVICSCRTPSWQNGLISPEQDGAVAPWNDDPRNTGMCGVNGVAADEVRDVHLRLQQDLATCSAAVDSLPPDKKVGLRDAMMGYYKSNREQLLDLFCEVVCGAPCCRGAHCYDPRSDPTSAEWLTEVKSRGYTIQDLPSQGRNPLCQPLLFVGGDEPPSPNEAAKIMPAVILDSGDLENQCDALGDDFVYKCETIHGDLEFKGVTDVDSRRPGDQRVQSQTLQMDVQYHACLPRNCDTDDINAAIGILADPDSSRYVQLAVALLLKTLVVASRYGSVDPAVVDSVLGHAGGLRAADLGLSHDQLAWIMRSLSAPLGLDWSSTENADPQVTLIDFYLQYHRLNYASLTVTDDNCYLRWLDDSGAEWWVLGGVVALLCLGCACCGRCARKRLRRLHRSNMLHVEAFEVGSGDAVPAPTSVTVNAVAQPLADDSPESSAAFVLGVPLLDDEQQPPTTATALEASPYVEPATAAEDPDERASRRSSSSASVSVSVTISDDRGRNSDCPSPTRATAY